ncbi:MAG: hypothetical protein KGZ79_12585 [Dethiobacter sp.]|jgi:sulfur carrier protein ThiS|nr:hypothetical protein [Dethiobacter sp.]
MENCISVYLEFTGYYAKLIKGKQTQIRVNTKLTVAVKEIQQYLRGYGIRDSSYILMLGEKNAIYPSKEAENIDLVEGDIFRVVPFISGG